MTSSIQVPNQPFGFNEHHLHNFFYFKKIYQPYYRLSYAKERADFGFKSTIATSSES